MKGSSTVLIMPGPGNKKEQDTKYLCVWTNDNPSTYVDTCENEAALRKFLDEMRPESMEYAQYIIRGRDLAIAKVVHKNDQQSYTF